MITTLANSGAISGGDGRSIVRAGGAGVSNAGTITTLDNSNSGKITGGARLRRTSDRRRRGVQRRHDHDAEQQRRDRRRPRQRLWYASAKGSAAPGCPTPARSATLTQQRRGSRWRASVGASSKATGGAGAVQLRHNHDADQQRRDERGRGRRLHCGRRRGRLQHRHDHDANQRWHDHWRLRWRQCSSETPMRLAAPGCSTPARSGRSPTTARSAGARQAHPTARRLRATPFTAPARAPRSGRSPTQVRSSAMSRSTISRA